MSESKKPKVFAILAIVLLAPTLIGVLSSLGVITGLINTFQAMKLYETVDPKLLAGAISQGLVTYILMQIVMAIVLVPGLIMASITAYKYIYTEKWYRIFLRIYSICMLLTFPIITIVGIYTFILSRRKT